MTEETNQPAEKQTTEEIIKQYNSLITDVDESFQRIVKDLTKPNKPLRLSTLSTNGVMLDLQKLQSWQNAAGELLAKIPITKYPKLINYDDEMKESTIHEVKARIIELEESISKRQTELIILQHFLITEN